MTYCTRFAPSPTGLLHLGHAYSALLAQDCAVANTGRFILRMEDTDTSRCRVEYEEAIYTDLRWLGIDWESPVMHQSDRLADYEQALNTLIEQGFCYPCGCSRRDIRDAISAPQEGQHPPPGPDGLIYPGTCRHRQITTRSKDDAIRLNMGRVVAAFPEIERMNFKETGPKHCGFQHLNRQKLRTEIGDIVLARRQNSAPSYHLAVVVDDAAQGITNVIRGADLFEATFIHRLLQALLDLPTPTYHHHRLIRDENGKRLAKRDDARAIQTYRAAGKTTADIRAMLGL